VSLDDIFGLGVIDHCHNTVADDNFENISGEAGAIENANFLLVGEGDLHGGFSSRRVMRLIYDRSLIEPFHYTTFFPVWQAEFLGISFARTKDQ
jgi:hypothetical protein